MDFLHCGHAFDHTPVQPHKSQTVQIGLSPSLSYVLGGPFYTDGMNMTFFAQSTAFLWPPPSHRDIKALGLDISPGYRVAFKISVTHPGVFYLAQFEQQFLSKTGKASLVPPPESSLAYIKNGVDAKVSGSLLALNMGIGCRLQSKGPTPYLAGILIFSRIGDFTIEGECTGGTVHESLDGENRWGFGFLTGLEWTLSRKWTLDTCLDLKNHAMWGREENQDFFITAGFSAGLFYTLKSANSQK